MRFCVSRSILCYQDRRASEDARSRCENPIQLCGEGPSLPSRSKYGSETPIYAYWALGSRGGQCVPMRFRNERWLPTNYIRQQFTCGTRRAIKSETLHRPPIPNHGAKLPASDPGCSQGYCASVGAEVKAKQPHIDLGGGRTCLLQQGGPRP